MKVQFPDLAQIANARRVLVFNSQDLDLARNEFMTRRLLYCVPEIQTIDVVDSTAKTVQEITALILPDVTVVFATPNKAKILTATIEPNKYSEEIYEFKTPVELVNKILEVNALKAKTPKNLTNVYEESKDAIAKYVVFENDQTTGSRFELEKQSYSLDENNPEVAWRYAVDLIERNIEKTKKEDFELAVKILEKVNLTNPLYGRLYLSAGIAYGKLGDVKTKIKCYETANQILTWNPWPNHNIGITYFNDLKDARKAIKYLNQSLATCTVKKIPEIPETHYNLYICYKSLREKSPGDFKQGLLELEQYIATRYGKYVEMTQNDDLTVFAQYPDHEVIVNFAELTIQLAEGAMNQKGAFKLAPKYFEIYLKTTWPQYFTAVNQNNYFAFDSMDQEKVAEFGSQLTKLIDLLIKTDSAAESKTALKYSQALEKIFPGDETVLEQRKKIKYI